MFAQLSPAAARRQSWLRSGSLVLHGVLLAWLLHEPTPLRLMANSVAVGQNGKSVTRLYWPSETPDDSTHSSSTSATERYRHQRLGHEKLVWKKPEQLAKQVAPQTPLSRTEAEDNSKSQTLSALGHGAQAGLPYGTLNRGPFYGDEIRPALPVATSDPVVYPWQLPDAPGNEVIEITIDERGEIVRKTVLQSLGPDIDSNAWQRWRTGIFTPPRATELPSLRNRMPFSPSAREDSATVKERRFSPAKAVMEELQASAPASLRA